MRSRLAVLLASCLVLSPLLAQDRPNLTGTWTLDPNRSESLASGAPPPATLVIQHGANELTIEAVRGSARDLTIYFFERMPPSPADNAKVGKWSWDGSRLVTDRITAIQGQTVTARQVYSLASSGAELNVETIVEVQHGYTLRGTKNYATAKDVYLRVKPEKFTSGQAFVAAVADKPHRRCGPAGEAACYSCLSASIGSSCDARLAG